MLRKHGDSKSSKDSVYYKLPQLNQDDDQFHHPQTLN